MTPSANPPLNDSDWFRKVDDVRWQLGLLAAIGVYLLTALIFRDPMTQTDARLSAARAFSFAEFRTLAKRAGWKNFGHARFASWR